MREARCHEHCHGENEMESRTNGCEGHRTRVVFAAASRFGFSVRANEDWRDGCHRRSSTVRRQQRLLILSEHHSNTQAPYRSVCRFNVSPPLRKNHVPNPEGNAIPTAARERRPWRRRRRGAWVDACSRRIANVERGVLDGVFAEGNAIPTEAREREIYLIALPALKAGAMTGPRVR